MVAPMKKMDVGITCPQCKQKVTAPLNLSKKTQDFVCPHCGTHILLNSERDSLEKQIDNDIKNALKKAGFK